MASICKVTKLMQTETAHRLLGHPALCKFLHGHSYKWEVTVEGEVGENGMVIDFSLLKQSMEKVIRKFDHAVVLEHADPLRTVLIAACEEQRMVITAYRPTAERMAQEVAVELSQMMNMHTTVKLWETETSFAEFTAFYYPGGVCL